MSWLCLCSLTRAGGMEKKQVCGLRATIFGRSWAERNGDRGRMKRRKANAAAKGPKAKGQRQEQCEPRQGKASKASKATKGQAERRACQKEHGMRSTFFCFLVVFFFLFPRLAMAPKREAATGKTGRITMCRHDVQARENGSGEEGGRPQDHCGVDSRSIRMADANRLQRAGALKRNGHYGGGRELAVVCAMSSAGSFSAEHHRTTYHDQPASAALRKKAGRGRETRKERRKASLDAGKRARGQRTTRSRPGS